MVVAVKSGFCRVFIFLACVALPSGVVAHQLDEYLQATLVSIEPNDIRLQINLTPGVAVADKVLALIDNDKSGVISTNEAAAYAASLQNDLIVQLDDQPVELKLNAVNFPKISELRTGFGIIQMDFSLKLAHLAAGAHKLKLENRHLPALSVYLFNAEQPDTKLVQITKQERNKTQTVGEIEFDYLPPTTGFKFLKYSVLATVLIALLAAGIWMAVLRNAPCQKAESVKC